MATILSLETSTNVCSVALHNNGDLLSYSEVLIQRSHSQLLTILVEEVLCHCGIKLDTIDAIAVSAGPGSYTGLRIGSSTAKGFCFSLDIPLISVNTLSAMAESVNGFNYKDFLLCPMIDARRMEVYCLIQNSKGKKIQSTEAVIIEETSFSEILENNQILFFGNGASKCSSIIKSPNAVFLDNIHPSAKYVGQLANQAYEENRFENVIYFEPFYLKEFISNTINL